MSLSIKNPPESDAASKTGASAPRSNPVCLELGVTIRSLPNEAGGTSQPIREEGRTVIVFDNGAVLRSQNTLPVGQSFILSNPNGRDVVCKVVAGRNLPSMKGYVEVEFLEPVKDFWSAGKDNGPAAVSVPPPPAPMLAPRETPAPPPAPPPPAPPLPVPSAEAQSVAKPASVPLGSGPSFEDIPGLVSVPTSTTRRESKPQPVRPAPPKTISDDLQYGHEITEQTSLAGWNPPGAELPAQKHAIRAMSEALSSSPAMSPARPRDFMSKGLMAYEQPKSSSGSKNRVPLILGAVAVVAAVVAGGAYFWMHQQGSAPSQVAKADVVSQTSVPEPQAQTPKSSSAPVQSRSQSQSSFTDQVQPSSAMAPVPAVVTNSESADSRAAQTNSSRQPSAAVAQQPAATTRKPAIPNLKISAPTAPSQAAANEGDGAAPLTDISSTSALGEAPSASLLTSSGRTSAPPAPPAAPAPPPAPAAPKLITDAKLISSVRPVYPTAARASSVQGSVSVTAYLDEKGRVMGAKATSGPMLLRQAAEDSVKQWKYSPRVVDGKPVPSEVTVAVDFRLN